MLHVHRVAQILVRPGLRSCVHLLWAGLQDLIVVRATQSATPRKFCVKEFLLTPKKNFKVTGVVGFFKENGLYILCFCFVLLLFLFVVEVSEHNIKVVQTGRYVRPYLWM